MKGIVVNTLLGLAVGKPAVQNGPRTPPGVNFGGWLNLEDWFYSGQYGTVVATGPDQPRGQGACLPPLLTQLDEPWPSEGALVKRLNNSKGPTETSHIFMAHRRSFIGTRDLEAARDLGINTLRLPINWGVFADALAVVDNATYGSHNPDTDAAVVPDPFYASEYAIVTVPRTWLKTFLKKARDHGLQVVLDMHAFPGGATDGTYNGIWPSRPAFWKHETTLGGDSKISLTKAGHLITSAMIKWVEELNAEEDKLGFAHVVKGVTLMNEPAHLSAGQSWADETAVLEWLGQAAAQFRKSSLPSSGTRLYMNIIETAFKDFGYTVPRWWNDTFTEQERHSWAVIDVHWYTAWGGGWSSGRVVDGGAYNCDDPLENISSVLQRSVQGYVDGMHHNFGTGLKAISEFSLGTFDQAMLACTDPAVTELFLDTQVKGFERGGIEAFMWTWRMPYGPAFEPGWSLKHATGKEVARNALPCHLPKSALQTQAATTLI